MARLECPNCGAIVRKQEDLAKVVLSTLSLGPAVPAMANQVRCSSCQHLFSQPDGGPPDGWRAYWPAVVLLGALVAAALLLPG